MPCCTSHIGRGSIGRFVCDAIRPQLHQAAQGETGTAFGMLSHLAKLVDANAVAEAKRRYMEKRYAAKKAT